MKKRLHKVLSLFSGIGAFEKALNNLEINYELINFCEFDKYAVKSYCAIHNVEESKNLGDITKVDEKTLPKNIDLITYGFPCQDISLAGKQKGLFNEDGTQTRSGLFFEALRIIEETKPRVAIAENVKNLTSKKFSAQFQVVLASLEAAGYNNYFQVLNAKDYGIPQNRERVFIVSVRKDVDTGAFRFPKGFPLELRLKDMLEDEVDEKFYLSEKMVQYFDEITDKNKARGNGNVYKKTEIDGCAKTITTREGTRVKDNFIECFDLYNGKQIDADCCGTITTGCSKNGSGTFLVREAKINVVGNYSPSGHDASRIVNENGIAPTIKENHGTVTAVAKANLRIRKLTPKECFRLMGFDDESFHRAEAVNSNTQLYKQAGNSIVVPVVEYLFKALIEAKIL